MKHLKSIMGLPDNTPHERLHFTIGEPDIKVRLLVRLLKNYRLYHTHFEEYPELYLKDLLYEFSKEEIEDSENEPEYKIIKMRLTNENLQEKFKKYYDFPLRFNHKEHLKRFFFCFPDKRDFLIIRYFTGTTVASNQRLFPICECGKENRPGHKANECAIALSEDERKDYLETVGKFYDKMKIERKETLHDYLVNIFYKLVSDDETTVRKVSTLVKEIVCKLIYSEKEKDEKEEEERED
jgi:hypothetical protein